MKKMESNIRDLADLTDLIVIGGGASGLMAAITASEHGSSVLLLEQQEKIGRKLSATGNGKCNFTNANMKKEAFFQGEGKDFVNYALLAFPPEKALAFFEESGIYTKEKKGYYYPLSEQAEFVKEALLFRLLNGISGGSNNNNNSSSNSNSNSFTASYGQGSVGYVKCKCCCRVIKIKREDAFFSVTLEDGYKYRAKKVILACGSMAAPQLGGTDLGLSLAQQMGHTIVPMLPALCGLKTSYQGWERAGNMRIAAEISIYYGKEKKRLLGKEFGELQITTYGISGIPVFQLSGLTARYLEKKEAITAVLNFFPEKRQVSSSASVLLEFLKKQKKQYPFKSIVSALSGILPEKLSRLVITEAFGTQKKNRQETVPIQSIEEEKLKKLINTILAFEIPVTGQTGFEHAQAASGGVSTKEICSKTMESKLVSGLYFAGELIDVVGNCGGYNLHWAWASGYLAGMAAAGVSIAEVSIEA